MRGSKAGYSFSLARSVFPFLAFALRYVPLSACLSLSLSLSPLVNRLYFPRCCGHASPVGQKPKVQLSTVLSVAHSPSLQRSQSSRSRERSSSL